MIFDRPTILQILLPLLLLVLFIRWRRRKNYVAHPLLFYLRSRLRPASSIVHLPTLLEYLALGFLLIAVLDPLLPSAEHQIMHHGLNTLMVLDLSSSMQEPINRKGNLMGQWEISRQEKTRLESVKEAMISFVQKRKHDNIGVVVFSENGYVVTPMTVDTSYLIRYLQMVDHKTLAGEGQTAIGEGIHTAVRLGEQTANRSVRKGKLIVVLTDGENNTGRDVYVAIDEASRAGFKIHFIGVEVDKAPDAPRLIAAVKATGGNYYDVRDHQQLEQAYVDIDRLEKGTFLTRKKVTYQPYFYPFVLASVLLLAASLAIKAIPALIEIS